MQVQLLKCSGWLLIAEVKSRFDPNTGGADPDKFVKAICELGFTSTSKVLQFLFYSFSVKAFINVAHRLSSVMCRIFQTKCLYCSTFRKRFVAVTLLCSKMFSSLVLSCHIYQDEFPLICFLLCRINKNLRTSTGLT